MHEEQAEIAAWVRRVMDQTGLSTADLARAAGVDATTIGRAANPNFASVTSVKTLAAIARGAKVPSIIDYLRGHDSEVESTSSLPSAEVLAGLLAAVLPLAARGRQTAQSLRVVASALQYGLELLGDQSSTEDADLSLGVAARGAVARFRDLTRQ